MQPLLDNSAIDVIVGHELTMPRAQNALKTAAFWLSPDKLRTRPEWTANYNSGLQFSLENLARSALRKGIDDLDESWIFIGREFFLAEGDEFIPS